MVYSRGGTDKTAADIAAACDADLYENWKEVDGVYSADPRIVKDADQMKEVTYKEIRELSYINFEVLHQEAMLPVMKKAIPINLRNLLNQDNPGTFIVTKRKVDPEFPIIGIAHKEKMAFINLEKILINEEIGFTGRLLDVFEKHHINIDQITTGIDSICLIVAADEFKTKTIYSGVSEQIRHEIDENEFCAHLTKVMDADQVNIRFNKALVCIVGEGMRHTVGLLSRISRVIAQNSINIETIDQGPSERNLIIGIDTEEDKDNAKKVVNIIYKEFFKKD
jgi:aspartate kinase